MDNPRDQTLGSFLREFRKEASAYIEARLELTRLSTYEKTAQLAAATIFFVVMAGLFTIIILLLSIALAIFIGKLFHESWLGFAAVAGLYLFITMLFYLFRGRINESIHSATLEILMKSDPKKNDQGNESAR